jgi:adenylate cyclase
VEVHANLVHMLATRRFVRAAGWLVGLAAQLLVVAVAGLVLTLGRPLAGTLLTLGLTLAVGLPASYLAFHRAGYAVDVVLPVLAICALGAGAEALRRRRLVDSFGRYVGREVLRAVLADSTVLQGDRREVSILVSDLRGFTTLSETMPAERVAAHLNEYFPAMVDAIFAHGGMINDFIGDGILAVFGAPVADPDHVAQAASAALRMQEALARLNGDWAARGLPALRMGIGVHTGAVFAGNVGGPGRIKYTVVGDVVNSTARLEGLNKELGTTTLITEEVLRVLGDRVVTRYCGEAPVKGRAQPLRVYELLAVRGAGGTESGGGS